MNDSQNKKSRDFGGMWNDHTPNFKVCMDESGEITITRPFASKTMTLNKKLALELRAILNDFLL